MKNQPTHVFDTKRNHKFKPDKSDHITVETESFQTISRGKMVVNHKLKDEDDSFETLMLLGLAGAFFIMALIAASYEAEILKWVFIGLASVFVLTWAAKNVLPRVVRWFFGLVS